MTLGQTGSRQLYRRASRCGNSRQFTIDALGGPYGLARYAP